MTAVTLEVAIYARSKRVNRLVACPFCGHEFAHNEPRWKHFLDDHDPEDAGLSPLGTIPPDHAAPLFGGGRRA